eukprot:2641633-Rhodomonas_salina.1
MDCFFETVASAWVFTWRRVRGPALRDDMVASAREQLQDALQRVEAQQKLYASQVQHVSDQ